MTTWSTCTGCELTRAYLAYLIIREACPVWTKRSAWSWWENVTLNYTCLLPVISHFVSLTPWKWRIFPLWSHFSSKVNRFFYSKTSTVTSNGFSLSWNWGNTFSSQEIWIDRLLIKITLMRRWLFRELKANNITFVWQLDQPGRAVSWHKFV